jgi:hypothetical protein
LKIFIVVMITVFVGHVLKLQKKKNYLPAFNKHHQLWKYTTMLTLTEKNGHIISGNS